MQFLSFTAIVVIITMVVHQMWPFPLTQKEVFTSVLNELIQIQTRIAAFLMHIIVGGAVVMLITQFHDQNSTPSQVLYLILFDFHDGLTYQFNTIVIDIISNVRYHAAS